MKARQLKGLRQVGRPYRVIVLDRDDFTDPGRGQFNHRNIDRIMRQRPAPERRTLALLGMVE